jgi:hypothetical protein
LKFSRDWGIFRIDLEKEDASLVGEAASIRPLKASKNKDFFGRGN